MATSADLIRLNAIVSADPDIQDAVVITKDDVINLVDTRVGELETAISDVEALVAFPNAYGVAYGVTNVGAALDTLNTSVGSLQTSVTGLLANVSTLQSDMATAQADITAINGGSATFYLARTNHTGTQTASTISDFSSAADARITAQKNAANGVAGLDAFSRIAEAQLPNVLNSTSFRTTINMDEHFVAGSSSLNIGRLSWNIGVSGVGAGVSYGNNYVDQLHPGVVELTTGTVAAGRACIFLNEIGVQFGQMQWFDEWLIYIPTLSTVAQEYTLRVGFGDSVSGDFVDGFYFLYDRLGLGVNWQARTANNSLYNTTDTGVPVATGWNRLRKVSDNTNVTYFLNGVQVASVLQSLGPIGGGRLCGPNLQVLKSAGATPIIIGADLFKFTGVLTSTPTP